MRRNHINYWLNLLALVTMFALAGTGFLLHFVLPPRSGGRSGGLELLGYDRHAWGTLHLYLAIAVLVLLVAHLVLHWSWVCCMTARIFGG